MTREELREHCDKQVEACLDWHRVSGKPLGLVYEEHKLVLDLLDQDADKDKRLEELLESLQTANKTNETLIKLLEGKRNVGKWLVNKEKDMVCCPFCMDKQKIGEAEVRLLDTAFAGFRFCRYCGAMMVGGEVEDGSN